MEKKTTKIILMSGLILGCVAAAIFPAKAEGLKPADSEAMVNFESAVQGYKAGINNFETAKRTLTEAQARLKNAGEDQKNKLKQQVRDRSAEFLKNRISAMIKYLDAMKNKVVNARAIDEVDQKTILAALNENISWLKAKEAEIEGASIEKLKEINQAVGQRWEIIRLTAKRLTGEILAGRIKFLIDKALAMKAKLTERFNAIKAKSSVSEAVLIEKAISDFGTKVDAAKEKYEAAKAKFKEAAQAQDKEQANNLIKEGRRLVSEARQLLAQSHKNLAEAVRRIKKLEGSISNSENATSTE